MKRRKILLVEDNPADVELTLRALKREHIENPVDVVTDGAEALDYLFGEGAFKARNLSNVPAVILLDLKMPKMGGLEVLKRMRSDRRTRSLPVVVLTSSSYEKDLATSYRLGANSYIIKPVDYRKFLETIKELGLYWLFTNEPPPHMNVADEQAY
jgi:two-component system response regulator